MDETFLYHAKYGAHIFVTGSKEMQAATDSGEWFDTPVIDIVVDKSTPEPVEVSIKPVKPKSRAYLYRISSDARVKYALETFGIDIAGKKKKEQITAILEKQYYDSKGLNKAVAD